MNFGDPSHDIVSLEPIPLYTSQCHISQNLDTLPYDPVEVGSSTKTFKRSILNAVRR